MRLITQERQGGCSALTNEPWSRWKHRRTSSSCYKRPSSPHDGLSAKIFRRLRRVISNTVHIYRPRPLRQYLGEQVVRRLCRRRDAAGPAGGTPAFRYAMIASGVAAYPGNTVFSDATPSCFVSTSAKTSRKSVLTARSRFSYRFVSPGHLP